MGIHRGPNPVKDGLVFGYDTGYGIADNDTATRFYPGRPMTNYLSSGDSNYNVVQGAAWHGATPTFTLGTSEFGTPIGTYTVGSTSYMYSRDEVLDDDLSTLSGQAVTFSVYLKRQGSNVTSTIGIRVYDNVSGYTTVYASATSEFQRFTLTKTLGVNPTRIFVMIDNTNGGVIDFHSPQLQIGDVSPFVDGTRSDTASLIDLKRTTNIDVSNVSFDSTGQPDFDGTTDYISLPDTSIFDISSEITVESVVKYESTGGNSESYSVITCKGYPWNWLLENQGGKFNFRISTANSSDSNINSQYSHGTTSYHHVVATYNGATQSIYVNGELKASKALTGAITTTASNIKIGTYTTNSYEHNGQIPVVKLYNQALSAAEIKQNYNAYKNRFDI